MREIKFRGWYGPKIGMLQPTFNGNINEIFADAHGVYMQYTGLKDVNGDEIYEGDIVRVSYTSFKVFKGVVKFGEYKQDGSGGEYSGSDCIGFYVEALNPDAVDEHGFKTIWDHEEESSLLEFERVEVIGNIYENPELLEPAK
jgi:uncharacterized phage protein (TIGR01671 family)